MDISFSDKISITLNIIFVRDGTIMIVFVISDYLGTAINIIGLFGDLRGGYNVIACGREV